MASVLNVNALAPQFNTELPTGGWDPADAGGGGGNTVTGGGYILDRTLGAGEGSGVSLIGHSQASGGKFYAEFVPTFAGIMSVGLAISTWNNEFDEPGDAANTWAIRQNGDTFTANSGTAHAGNAFVSGETVGIAVDFTAGEVWFRDGAGWTSGDPAAGTSPQYSGIGAGTYYLVAATYTTADEVLLKPGSGTAFTYTPPAGFSNWG